MRLNKTLLCNITKQPTVQQSISGAIFIGEVFLLKMLFQLKLLTSHFG